VGDEALDVNLWSDWLEWDPQTLAYTLEGR